MASFNKISQIDRQTLGYLERERTSYRKRGDTYMFALADALIRDIRKYGYFTWDAWNTAKNNALNDRDYTAIEKLTKFEKAIDMLREEPA